jgi:hypothetical protein
LDAGIDIEKSLSALRYGGLAKKIAIRMLARLGRTSKKSVRRLLLGPLTTQGLSALSAKSRLFFFLLGNHGGGPHFPNTRRFGAIILTKIECPPGTPDLICTPESGGHLTAPRSDTLAQCLGLSPAGSGDVAGDVAALCVSDGYASVNVQGWFIGGQTSNVTMADFNVWQSKRYFHEQCIDRSTGNP